MMSLAHEMSAQRLAEIPFWLPPEDDPDHGQCPDVDPLAPDLPQVLACSVARAWNLRQRHGALSDELLARTAPFLDRPSALNHHDPLWQRAARRWLVTQLERRMLSADELAANALLERLPQLAAQGPTLESVDAAMVATLFHWGCGHFARADAALDSAIRGLQVLERPGEGPAALRDPVRRDKAVLLRFVLESHRSEPLDAGEWARRLAEPRDSSHPVVRGVALRNLAELAQRSGQPLQALAWLEEAVVAMEAGGNLSGALWSRADSAALYVELGDVAHGLEIALQTLDRLRSLNWPFHQGHALNRLGEIYVRLGSHEDAQRAWLDAHELLCLAPQRWMACHAKLGIAGCLRALGRLDQAQAWLVDLDEVAGLTRQTPLQVRGVVEQARVALARGATGEAHARLTDLMRQHRVLSPPSLAKTVLETAAALFEAAPGLPALPGLGLPADGAQDPGPDLALDLLQRRRALIDPQVPGLDDVQCLDHLSDALAARGDAAGALQVARDARRAMDECHARMDRNTIAAIEVRHDVERIRAREREARQAAREAQQRAEHLDDLQRTLERLSSIGRQLATHLQMGDLLLRLKEGLKSLMDADAMMVLGHDAEADVLQLLAGRSAGQALPAMRIPLQDERSMIARCARARQTLSLHGLDERIVRIPDTPITHSAVFLPLLKDDELIGVLSVQSEARNAYGPRELALLESLSAYVAVAVDNARAWDQQTRTVHELERTRDALQRQKAALEQASLTDALTGLWNRRFIEPRIDAELRRLQQSPTGTERRGLGPEDAADGFALMLVDLDHFKRINDELGHAMGDKVLKRAAAAIQSVLRPDDQVARWGGEEFIVLSCQAGPAQAQAVGERIRAAVAAMHEGASSAERLPRPVTCSIGWSVCSSREAPQAWAPVLEQADQALYAAKGQGRNRVLGAPAAETPVD